MTDQNYEQMFYHCVVIMLSLKWLLCLRTLATLHQDNGETAIRWSQLVFELGQIGTQMHRT